MSSWLLNCDVGMGAPMQGGGRSDTMLSKLFWKNLEKNLLSDLPQKAQNLLCMFLGAEVLSLEIEIDKVEEHFAGKKLSQNDLEHKKLS